MPLKFQREGIKYDDLSEEDKEQWDALEWNDEDGTPREVDAAAVNKWLFNVDTVDKVLAHLMTRGLKVGGGDDLGKTIVFAKNQQHADFIADRFNVNYPKYKGEFARVITFKSEYAQHLIDQFSNRQKMPRIAISVDMLDTGIDVPEVVNLVFFKIVRSKTKFWQMVGRGTRLCPDLFGPGRHKDCFHLFDYCQNLEFFGQHPGAEEGSAGQSLGTRLFTRRLDVLAELDERLHGAGRALVARERPDSTSDPQTEAEVRHDVSTRLHAEVAAMNVENFVVRPRRRVVEKFAKPGAWTVLSAADRQELATEVAGLPTELDPEPEEAKRFDLLLLRVQLAMLRHEPRFESLRDQVRSIAGLLEEKGAIPMVREQMAFILDVQTDEWWQDATLPMLESVRRRLRSLVQFIDRRQRTPMYTDFEDEMGGETRVVLPGFGATGEGFEKFRVKARVFLRAHQDHVAVHKLRLNRTLNASDVAELERMLAESGVGGPEDIARATAESQGLGVFVRSLVGLDREAAKQALAGFLAGKTLGANQIEFVDLIVNHLTEHGVIDTARLYASPFTDVTPRGPEALFSEVELDELVDVLDRVTAAARAA